ncbi:MAG: glucose-1-phosphate thymidylyltransferase [Parcubacteria group bacterium CG11_big_fil_rev_8_21_14_0_20_39_14]|nr:MAG: glucose-1-phosphate thymidylyltransferase [Parcubacteria group bacterium CG11_big_fil_rev_8_21_14_0_20_39_14]
MQALLTAGGHGTRLRPITYTLNKHLIPLANKPMIFYALEKIAEANIKDVFINVNPGDKEIFQAVGNGKRWGLNVKYIEQTGGPKGLAHILKIAQPYLGDESFIFYLGDNLIFSSINKFVEKFEREKYHSLLTLSKVKDPQRFGVPEISKDGKILRVEEKPKNPKSNFAVTGIYIYSPEVFRALEHIKPSFRGELEISDVHTWLINNGYNIGYEEITGWWKDTGRPEDLLEGNDLLLRYSGPNGKIEGKVERGVILDGKVTIGKGSKVFGKTIIKGPAIIGKNCQIKNSFIGPNTSIGDNARISESEIERSIILANSFIKSAGKKITNSLIGEGARIIPNFESLPSGHRLIIGKDSQIEL